jgi:hypothetical protein
VSSSTVVIDVVRSSSTSVPRSALVLDFRLEGCPLSNETILEAREPALSLQLDSTRLEDARHISDRFQTDPDLGRAPPDHAMALRWDELDDGEDFTPATPGALLVFAPAPPSANPP